MKILLLIMTILLIEPSGKVSASEGAVARARIEKMIHSLRGQSNVALYEMTVSRPSWTRSVKMRVWDERAKKRVFVRILEPAKDRDISFLRIGYNLWNYLPSVEKTMKIPPSMMLQSWMGSDFTNDDLVKESSYVEDYEHHVVGREMRDGAAVDKIELIPLPHAPVVWGKVIFWLRTKDDLPVEQHFLDERGRLIKDLLFEDYKVLDGALLPARWEMRSVQKEGQKTVLNLLSIDFDPSPPIPDSIFTERNLKP